jgi:aspartate racemase
MASDAATDSPEVEPEAIVAPLKIGIAACSSEGAALCYRTIIARSSSVMGKYRHPEIVLHSPSLGDYVDALEQGDLARIAEMMISSARRLAGAGADFVICPDNTIHAAMPLVSGKSPLPWLHIAEVVAAEAQRLGIREAAVLGTKWLVESEVYPSALASVGIRHQRPEPEEVHEINRIIMEELVHDVQKDNSIRYIQELIARMKQRGCDAVVLGCTEIPIVIGNNNSPLPTLDSTRLLADEAVSYAITHSDDAGTHGRGH